MKKLIVLLSVIVLLFSSIVYAAPYLKSDCHDYVEWYEITVDNGTPIIVDAIDGASTDTICTGNQKRLSYDLEPLGLADGQHNITLKGVNVWGETTDIPFDFNKAVPASAIGIGLSLTP